MASASTATCPNVRDDGRRPSGGTGWRHSSFDLPDGLSGIFLREGLDSPNSIERLGEFRSCEQRNGSRFCGACFAGPDTQEPQSEKSIHPCTHRLPLKGPNANHDAAVTDSAAVKGRDEHTLFAMDALFSRPRTKNYQGHQADAHQQPWSGNPSDTGSCDLFCKAIDEVIVATRLAPQAETVPGPPQ